MLRHGGGIPRPRAGRSARCRSKRIADVCGRAWRDCRRAVDRGRSRPEWLLECLRVAVHLNVFAIENGQTTIGHLTNEQLRSLRLPFPEPETQDRTLGELHDRQAGSGVLNAVLGRESDLLQEYKQSLLTAAVTGEIDVMTTGSGIPG